MRGIPRLAALLGPLLLAVVAGAAHAGEQADKAAAAVRQLIARGEIKPNSVLKLRLKQGNVISFLGRESELQNHWERLTGTVIDASVMPQLDSLESIRNAKGVDLSVARSHEYPDLYASGLIEDLSPYLQRFGFTLPDDRASGYMLPRMQAYFGARVVAIPADLDMLFLYLRSDMMEDPANRARFREQYKRELQPPRTWSEYQQLLEFFHRPNEGIYGSAETREKLTGWMYWMPRYTSFGVPNQYLFDDQMKPLVNSPAGIAATEHYVATVPYAPPEVAAEGKDYSYALPFFLRGNAFSTIFTIASAKIANRDTSAVRDKFTVVPMPGTVVGDQLVRRTPLAYGNNLVVPKNAPNKTLAFLFAMWVTDPDNSARSVKAASGLADPYRYANLRDEQLRALYTPKALDTFAGELPNAVPSGTGLPGDHEYLGALSLNIWMAARRELTPREAMDKTAREWEAITERLGRARQIAHWKAFKRAYPTVTENMK